MNKNRLLRIKEKMIPEKRWITVYNRVDDMDHFFYHDPTQGETPITLTEAEARWAGRDDFELCILRFTNDGRERGVDVY